MFQWSRILLLWLLAGQLGGSLCAQVATSAGSGGVSVYDFGAKADGITDDTPAFNSALDAALPQSRTVYFPCGKFRFASRPKAIETGVRIRGCGSTGSTANYGTALIADYDESVAEEGFLTWNGAYKKGGSGCCAGTGGGLENITVYKGAGKKGGAAIKITGIDDGHRAGYTTISDVLVSSIGGGTWDHNLVIDGTCCTTPHAQGVRDTYINNFWAAQSAVPNQSVLLKSAIQVFWHGGEIMPAGSGVNPGITIMGGSEITHQSVNIFISDVYVAGSLNISNAFSVSFRGLVGGDATIEGTASNVFLGGLVGGNLLNRSRNATIVTNQSIDLPQGRSVTTSGLQSGTPESTDLAGQISLIDGRGNYRFKKPYKSPPICVAQDLTAARPTSIAVTNVEIRISGSGADQVNFICVGRN
jgi:hypothetical protein